MTAITETESARRYPGSSRNARLLVYLPSRTDTRDRENLMSLGALALTGLVSAIVVIVVAISLINKFAN